MPFRPFRQLKALASVARTVAGQAIGSVWSRIGGLGIGSRLRYLLPGSRFDFERDAGDLWLNSTVAICLKFLSDNFVRPRLKVVKVLRDGSRLEVMNHPLVRLLRRPNPHYTWRTVVKAVCLSLKCDGNAYLIKVRNGFGVPVQLWWVPHWCMQPVWPEDGSVYIRAYQFLLDYQLIEFKPEDVVHFREGIDPRNDRLGIAPLKAQLREVCTDNEISGYNANIMRNCGVPGLVAVPRGDKGKFSPSEAEKVKEEIRDSYTADNRGDTAVFSQQVDLKPLGFSPEQLRVDKTAAWPVSKICAAFGFSPMAVNLPDPGKTYSNYKVGVAAAWRHSIVPTQDDVAETLHWSLLPEFDDPHTHALEWDYTAVEAMQEDLESKHGRVRDDWTAGLLTHAAANTLLGYEVDPDGDRYYPGTVAGDTPALPAPGAPKPPQPGAGDDDGQDDDGGESEGD